MKEIIIAFDVDGTIYGSPLASKSTPRVNLPVIMLIQLLSEMKNTKIIAWSGGGKDYCEQIIIKFGLDKYIERCYGKQTYDETIDGKVDIAFDDEHLFSLADKNIIVRTK